MHGNYIKNLSKRLKLSLSLSLTFLLALFLSRNLFGRGLIKGTDILIHVTWLTLCSRNDWWFQLWVPLYSFGEPLLLSLQFNVFLFSISKIMLNNALLAMKIYIFLSIFLAGLSMFFLSRYYTRNYQANLLSAFVYMTSQYFFSQLFEGHIVGLVFNYAMAPFLFLFFDRALLKNRLKESIIAGVILASFVITGYPISIYIMLPSVFCFLIFKTLGRGKTQYINFTKVLIVSVGVCFGLLAYQILPFLGRTQPIYLSKTYAIEEAYFWSNKNLLDALATKATELSFIQRMEYPLPAFLQVIAMCWIPVFAFTVVLFRRDRTTLFFSLSAIFCSFLAKGPNPPLGEIYIWLWNNIPGFSAIRVGSRWSMITMISYSSLVGMSYSEISARLRRLEGKKSLTVKSLRLLRKIKLFFYRHSHNVLIGIFITVIILNSWAGFAYSVGTYDMPQAYTKSHEWISQQPGDFNVLTLPYAGKIVNTSWSGIGRDPGYYYSPAIHGKSVIAGQGGTVFSQDFLSFIGNSIHYNRTDDLMKILGALNVKYVVVQPHAYETERIRFFRQKGLRIVDQYEDTMVMENDYWVPHIFAATHYALVVGGQDIFMSLCEVDDFNLSQWTLIFAHQLDPKLLDDLLKNADAIIFSGDGFEDLVMITLNDGIRIRAAQYAFPSSNPSTHWMASKWWTDWGKLVINRFTLMTNGPNEVSIPFNVQSAGEYDIWLRVAFAPDRGKLSVLMEEPPLLFSFVPYAHAYNGFKWVKVESAHLRMGENVLKLVNDGSGFNDIDEVAIVPHLAFESKSNEVRGAIESSRAMVLYVLEAENALTFSDIGDWHINKTHEAGNGYALICRTYGEPLSTDIFIPKSGLYMVNTRILTYPGGGRLVVDVEGNYSFDIVYENSKWEWKWFSLGPIQLPGGQHRILISNPDGVRVDVDEIILHSLQEEEGHSSLSELFKIDSTVYTNYERVNPSEYVIQAKANESFFLIFSQSHHPLWKAYLNGRETSSVIAYSFINGFYINQTGEFTVTIRFVGQRYVFIGGAISVSFLIVTVAFLFLKNEKSKRKVKSILLALKRRID